MIATSLRTIPQLADELPAFTESALRSLIFDAETNGLAEALVRVRSRVYVDLEAFNLWLEKQRVRPLEPQRGRRRR